MVKKLTEAQTEIIKVVHNLPPVKSLFFMCASQDQLQHYASEKNYWHIVGLGLKAYFSGLSIKQTLRDFINKEPPEFLILEIDCWLKFYDVINFGWDDIVAHFDKSNLVMICDYKNPNKPCIACPGDTIRYILESKSYYTFAQCLEDYYTFSPQTFYRDYKTWEKIKNKNITGKPLSKSEKKVQDKITTKVKFNKRDIYKDGAYLQQLLIDVLAKSRNRTIKKKLREYLKTNAESRAELLKFLHPSKKVKGHAWSKGKRKEGNRGYYA